MPYKNLYLNYLQILSSVSLLIINACNVPASFSFVFDLMVVSGIEDVSKGLQYIEYTVLSVVPSSLVVWKLQEIIPTKRQSKQQE